MTHVSILKFVESTNAQDRLKTIPFIIIKAIVKEKLSECWRFKNGKKKKNVLFARHFLEIV